MNKKFAALTIAILMIVGLIPALSIPRANAQGECVGAFPFGSPMCVFLHPGIPDEYKPGFSHTLDTLWSAQDTGISYTGAQFQQVLDNYLNYAILANSVGDLQFDLTVMSDVGYIEIYVPPEFKWLGPSMQESIWTDITNDYMFVQTYTASAYDPIAPNWTVVQIGIDPFSWGVLTIVPDTYHIRLFNLQAPASAGLYHFKIYASAAGGGPPATSIGAGNFPFVIVKTELNPAFAQVTLRTHAFGGPDVGGPYVSGWVHAEGTTPEGRTVEGVGYFGPNEFIATSLKAGEFGALYTVWLFGLAAGTYTFTAEASGFGPGVAERITLEAGQSMEGIFILMYDSPDVSVTIYSKHGTGEIPWNNLWQLPCGTNDPTAAPDDEGPWRDIMLELYDADNNLIGFWASNVCDFYGVAGAHKFIADTNTLIGLHDDGVLGSTPEFSTRANSHGGVWPTLTNYVAKLTDNWDLLNTLRGYPSTHWDGHVPWDTADYIAGMGPGQYTVEAFVTGYVMEDGDAYQRTFSLTTSAMNVIFDLRRSNWIEVEMHGYSGAALSVDTTVVLTAEDADGKERGAAAFTQEAGLIEVIPAIVIEGWNGVFPNVGSARTRQAAAGQVPDKKDYGLNPTASTHSAGAVSLAGNPYTIKLYMSDMGSPSEGVLGSGWWNVIGADPQVSVFLCNSPASLSFSITNAYLWISLRSVDFEVPAHSRPWTFPGSEIWVEFTDSEGNAVAWLDPTIYGLVQDPDGVTPFDVDNVNPPGLGEHLGVRYCGLDLVPVWGGIMRAASGELRPTRMPAGQYSFAAYTHGYTMRRSFPVQVPFSGGGDIEADMIQGGQIRVLLEFRHEGEVTPFNGFVRVEVFNEAGDLVGANVYGEAQPNENTQQGYGGGYLGYQGWADWQVVPGPSSATGWPDEASDACALHPGTCDPDVDPSQRGFWSSIHYGVPEYTWADWTYTNPSDANRLWQEPEDAGGLQYFDVYGFYWYFGGAARTWAGGWPTVTASSGPSAWTGNPWDSGLRGSVDIPGWSNSGGGKYTVKVWAFDPRGPDNTYGSDNDWRMYSMGWELTDIEVPWGGATEIFMTMNNMASIRGEVAWFDMFGNIRALPWAQITASPGPGTDTIPAYAAGYEVGPSSPASGYIMWVPAGTHDVSVSTSEAPQVWSSSAPTYNMDYSVVVSDGWIGGAGTRLSQSGTPVPELPSFVAPLALFAALAASVWLLRKRTLNAPVLMK